MLDDFCGMLWESVSWAPLLTFSLLLGPCTFRFKDTMPLLRNAAALVARARPDRIMEICLDCLTHFVFWARLTFWHGKARLCTRKLGRMSLRKRPETKQQPIRQSLAISRVMLISQILHLVSYPLYVTGRTLSLL